MKSDWMFRRKVSVMLFLEIWVLSLFRIFLEFFSNVLVVCFLFSMFVSSVFLDKCFFFEVIKV